MQNFWLMIALIAFAGALGGAANALMTENGFIFPKSETTEAGATIVRPGFLGNVFTGALASVVSWGLYGPLSSVNILSLDASEGTEGALSTIGLSLASLVGGILVGVGGARWLSNEVDKNLLKAAAVVASGKQSSINVSQRIALATPAQTLKIVNDS